MVENAKKNAFVSDAKMIISGIDYRKLECDMGVTTEGCPSTSVILPSALSYYGANPANYTAFKITNMSPITIELTSATTSQFGVLSGSGTKATFAIAP
ncbi:MAG: hypothetical protein PHS98_00410 [Bacilli bacterium]|nr:hypothetical protein [Bacilli bacterium]